MAEKEKTYDETQIAERLRDLPGWFYEDKWIRRVYKTDGWPTTLLLVNQIAFLAEAALELAPSHGRILLVDPSIGNAHTGHGIVMPFCIHGGPGRAGGGEELGAFRGLWFYHQRVGVQASATTLTSITQHATNPATSAS